MNAADLLDFVSSVQGSRESGASGNGVVRGRLLSGIEYAETTSSAERALRANWRKRHGGGATPLVLIANGEEEGTVVVLGPQAADGPVRTVRAEALRDLIGRTSQLSDLRAVRLFAQEIERLDAAGVAGLIVRGLGTYHLFETRLPRSPRWVELTEIAADIRGEDWLDLLRSLGYEVEALPTRGFLARYDSHPIAVIHPQDSPDEFSRLDESGSLREGALLAACAEDNVPYGILAAGARMRVFAAAEDQGGIATRYLELDADLLEEQSQPLLALIAPAYLAEGEFSKVLEEARDYGAELRERLDRRLRQEVLPKLGSALGRWAAADGRDLSDDGVREDLEGACLGFVFRSLFLLYAESAGFLPMAHSTYQQRSMTRICERAQAELPDADPTADTLWGDVQRLVKAMRTGQTAWGVPPYNGELFSTTGIPGAKVLEEASIPDGQLAEALVAVGRDPGQPETGVDFSGLEIGHLGHIYESLLSLRLSVADRDLCYDERLDRYVTPGTGEEPNVQAGELIWMTNEGGRKSSGVYYTRTELVRHLVKGAVRPALGAHLDRIRELAETDPSRAAKELFEFHVLDPACGSAHFLVEVVGEIADRIVQLLGETPLPALREELEGLRATAGKAYGVEVEDAALLKRLVLKRCAFGVDLSPMGAEIAKLSLWLATFVPGLSLAYLDRNVRVGNSLIGVANTDEVADAATEYGQFALFGNELGEALERAAAAADELQQIQDRTPDEIERSREKARDLEKTLRGAHTLLDLWTAEPLGHLGARQRALEGGAEIIAGKAKLLDDNAVASAREQSALHWPIAFPETFARRRPGFDVVVGNPPWEEVNVDRLTFLAAFRPGLRGLNQVTRETAIEELLQERPELEAMLEAERERVLKMNEYLKDDDSYIGAPGNADLYKAFCQRYQRLVREGGHLGVVLPRGAFLVQGAKIFREWLLDQAPPSRIDFLLNSGRWAFDSEPRYTVALVAAERRPAREGDRYGLAGVADSIEAFRVQVTGAPIELSRKSLGPGNEFPLCKDQTQADLLARIDGTPFPFGGNRWMTFPVQGDFNETSNKQLWAGASEGWRLWKGQSFDQFDPNGAEERVCPANESSMGKARKPRPGGGSLLAEGVPVSRRAEAVARTVGRARVAFRDVTRATDSRTVRACLVPPETFLTNKAPYLTFVEDDPCAEAACLGVMNSLPFDWQARRFVEVNLNFFILELLKVPKLSDEAYDGISERAARLSCRDQRFADFAAACGVEVDSVGEDERDRLRAEIDALVAQAWGLDHDDLDVIFADFTETAVAPDHRQAIHEILDCVASAAEARAA